MTLVSADTRAGSTKNAHVGKYIFFFYKKRLQVKVTDNVNCR